MLWRGEQAVRDEAWGLLPTIHRAYFEAFDRLRTTLEQPYEDHGVREELVELERHQRRLVREFRQGQRLVKARMDDLNALDRRLDRLKNLKNA